MPYPPRGRSARSANLTILKVPSSALNAAINLEKDWRSRESGNRLQSFFLIFLDILLLYGTEEQKKNYLPPIVKGDWVMGFSITEPEAGSDAASVTTTAVRVGDECV